MPVLNMMRGIKLFPKDEGSCWVTSNIGQEPTWDRPVAGRPFRIGRNRELCVHMVMFPIRRRPGKFTACQNTRLGQKNSISDFGPALPHYYCVRLMESCYENFS